MLRASKHALFALLMVCAAPSIAIDNPALSMMQDMDQIFGTMEAVIEAQFGKLKGDCAADAAQLNAKIEALEAKVSAAQGRGEKPDPAMIDAFIVRTDRASLKVASPGFTPPQCQGNRPAIPDPGMGLWRLREALLGWRRGRP